MKKIIGVMPLWDDEKESIWMLPGYLEGIKEAGGIPFIFPLLTEEKDIICLCEKCDGFLLTGGHDVSPSMYGEMPMDNVESCNARDVMENIVFSYAIRNNKAVLGICRGIQFINVALGGTLYQDIPSQFDTIIDHHMEYPYDRECHKVNVVGNTPLHILLNCNELGVNSYHHQAIKDLAESLSVMANSEDGLIEAVYMPSMKFVWAIQWHPEFSYKVDENSKKIFVAFINLA